MRSVDDSHFSAECQLPTIPLKAEIVGKQRQKWYSCALRTSVTQKRYATILKRSDQTATRYGNNSQCITP
jgi:hypothetical protein